MTNQPDLSASARVGQNVRRLRLNHRQTLAEVSARLDGIGHRLGLAPLSKLELGQRKVEVADLEALAAVLRVTVDRLLAPPDADGLARVVAVLERLDAARADLDAAKDQMRAAGRAFEFAQDEVAAASVQIPAIVVDLRRELDANKAAGALLPSEILDRAREYTSKFRRRP